MRTDRENQDQQPHPLALYFLLSVVFFERVAGGIIISLLALYLREHRAFEPPSVFLIVGSFFGSSYLLSAPAGELADRRLGHERSVLLGLGLITIGQAALLADRRALLWLALGFIFVGMALYRVSLPTLLGRLYGLSDPRRSDAFGWFYAALNLGYLIGPFGGEWLRARYGWPTTFVAGVGALGLAMTIFLIGYRRIAHATAHENEKPYQHRGDFAQRERAVYLVCGLAIIFWMALQQPTTSLTFFAEANTTQTLQLPVHRLTLHPGYFATLHGLAVLILTPILFGAIKRWRRNGAALSMSLTLACGLLFTAAAFAVMSAACLFGAVPRASVLWLANTYFLMSFGEVLYSAMGLAFVTELAPPRLAGRMNGLWFAAVSVGNLGAGAIGGLWTRLPHHRYFAILAALLCAAALVLFLRAKKLDAMLRD